MYHDYGLTCICVAVCTPHAQLFVMSPLDFVERPYIWVASMAKFRVTSTAAPVFGYDLVARKWSQCPSSLLELMGPFALSSLAHCSISAEPIKLSTLQLFAHTFAPYGFKRWFLKPTYGLAESVCWVGQYMYPEDPTGHDVVRARKDPNRVAVGGPFFSGSDLAVVDPETGRLAADGVDGEICVRSRAITSGYWDRPDLNDSLHVTPRDAKDVPIPGGPFLRTGDGGFMESGYLFINSRLKDVMIIRVRDYSLLQSKAALSTS